MSKERGNSSKTRMNKSQESLLAEAVAKARRARGTEAGGETTMIMRDMLFKSLNRSSRKFKVVIGFLVATLTVVVGWAGWTIHRLEREKTDIDAQIRQIESTLRGGGEDSREIDLLIEKLSTYQAQARDLQRNLLYRLGVRTEEQDFIASEIRALMLEFGAEEYSIPPEFEEQVRRFILHYQGTDRPNMERALGGARKNLDQVRKYLQEDNLPPDLGYMVLVESAFISESASDQGAAGFWQFTPSTAQAYGMVVSDTVDDRLDLQKSTRAAGRYIRDLILDFGSGSSVMLALAAYNVGPGKVKRAMRNVQDPIKQRNFWYLYRVRALPAETREYVPKIIAAMIIGRNPERFGF